MRAATPDEVEDALPDKVEELAGNLAAAIAVVRPYGVDVSSGAETNGKKDPAKMAALVALARAAEYR